MISCSVWYTVCTPTRTTSSPHRWSSPKSVTDKASYQSWLELQAHQPTNRDNTNPRFRAAVLAYNVWPLRTIRCGVQTFHHYDMIPTDGMGSSGAHRFSPEFHRLLQGGQCWSQHENHSKYLYYWLELVIYLITIHDMLQYVVEYRLGCRLADATNHWPVPQLSHIQTCKAATVCVCRLPMESSFHSLGSSPGVALRLLHNTLFSPCRNLLLCLPLTCSSSI